MRNRPIRWAELDGAVGGNFRRTHYHRPPTVTRRCRVGAEAQGLREPQSPSGANYEGIDTRTTPRGH
ncbi:unnamed protein product [Caenorhabditis auriculariae]|uniref:Uncharacterized protein n=1 Tax=Caenorhabditis auriculariae TaxID=2777116 RepID=A0A8S1GY88_9PELO|nr:unnamed protein product [Caenorhabditis auriculariae]